MLILLHAPCGKKNWCTHRVDFRLYLCFVSIYICMILWAGVKRHCWCCGTASYVIDYHVLLYAIVCVTEYRFRPELACCTDTLSCHLISHVVLGDLSYCCISHLVSLLLYINRLPRNKLAATAVANNSKNSSSNSHNSTGRFGAARGYLTWNSLPEEHTMIREMCRNFADNELAPNAGEWDKNHTFPKDQVRLS